METGFLNFRDEEHFSDFSLSLEEHNLMEKPQDLLMHIVENDFDYMETHLDVANSDCLWGNEEDDRDVAILPISDMASVVPRMDNIKEDFAKVLTDWQEHIGYLQASDMEEYMDIIGVGMATPEKRNICLDSLENEIIEEKTNVQEKQHIFTVKGEIEKKELCNIPNNLLEQDHVKSVDPSGEVKLGIKVEVNECMTNKVNSSQFKTNKRISRNERKNSVENIGTKQRKRKKNSKIQSSIEVKQETENEDCVDVETVPDEIPVLEAGDVKSLLEQFEASEKSDITTKLRNKRNEESNQNSSMKLNKLQTSIKQTHSLLIDKETPRTSDLHKNIRDSLPKEVIDRIKASGRKRVISVIPAMPNIQSGARSNGTRMQEAAATLSRNKLLKIVTNNTNIRTVDGGSVQLDHDYCSNSSSAISSSESNSEYERQYSDSEKTPNMENSKFQQTDCYITVTKRTSVPQCKNIAKSAEYCVDKNIKKDSGLESGEISDASEEPSLYNNNCTDEDKKQIQNQIKECQKGTPSQALDSKHSLNSIPSEIVSKAQNVPSSKPTPVYEMKIRSALATSILQLRKGMLDKTNHKGKQMVSVLKKPPNAVQPIFTNNPNESIVTTTNSSNGEVQNIIIQNTQEIPSVEETKKPPPRRKLNLAEYRSRREQNRSDSSRTNSPIQPMTLVYVHHASTTTEPIKDNAENLIWSEREIISVLKPKADLDEEKNKPKPVTNEIGIQTYETVFEFPTKNLVDVDDRKEEQRTPRVADRKQRPYRKRRLTSTSSSRSRSRSESKSKSRSRSRSRSTNRHRRRSRSDTRSRSRSRSKSRRRSNTRRRRISHRRSSVSSSTSWTSRSRSHTRSTSRSRSPRYSRSRSRSRSRSFRSRSRSRSLRSRSSSRYSSCSRSSSRSNFGRSRWSSRGRRERRERRRSYDRYRRRSSESYRGYRDWRRSPSSSYRKPYDGWYDREKQRQVEERRVVYVGRLEEGVTKADLRRRFEVFGPVVDISVHFREHGDNYGFVTFAYKNDAYDAVEHGNDDPALPRYDLCFGGRRAFCKVKYADLDGLASNSLSGGSLLQNNEDNTFDLLLKEAKAKLRKRKV